EGCTWIAQYGQRSDARLKVYRCIADLAQLADPNPFESALALLYGRETLQQAFALFNQDKRFFGLTALGSNFEGSAIHQRLLEAYRKVRS
ncbi:MAG: 30s ribosomal protein S12 methylthiotransferase accessory protein YcaO, partial [Thiobacillus sp.]|nr:30s ribosomal protein S12 methylthiotransferase accessory protein YcaO [Thiobacillus sp.]